MITIVNNNISLMGFNSFHLFVIQFKQYEYKIRYQRKLTIDQVESMVWPLI